MRSALLLIVAIMPLCKKPATSQPNRKELLKVELRKFFELAVDPKNPIIGLFRVDGENLAKSMEQKYLKGYKAQPDELSLEAIRTRMKNTTIFFRISQGGAIAMATVTPGNIGVSQGIITRVPGNTPVSTWQGKLKNRKGEITIKIRHKLEKNRELFEYLEADSRLEGVREKRAPDELTKAYTDIIMQGTGLAEY